MTGIYYGVLYKKQNPFRKFVNHLVERRIAHSKTNAPAAKRAKDIMNSAIGKFGENLEKHNHVMFLGLDKLWFHMRNPYYRGHEIMGNQPDANVICLKKKKRRVNDSLATHMNGSLTVDYFFLCLLFSHQIER